MFNNFALGCPILTKFYSKFECSPSLIAIRHPPTLQMERVTAICIFDDIIEFGGAVAAQYIPAFLPFVFQHCAHVDVEIRQACLYGVGVMAQVRLRAGLCGARQGGEGRQSATEN